MYRQHHIVNKVMGYLDFFGTIIIAIKYAIRPGTTAVEINRIRNAKRNIVGSILKYSPRPPIIPAKILLSSLLYKRFITIFIRHTDD